MSKVYLFLADGCEEVEALTVVDLLRRASVDVKTVSVMGREMITSSHNITIKADMLFDEISEEVDMLVLPGGIPGTPNLEAHEGLMDMVREYNTKGKWLAAVCAAPTIYGRLGLLEGKMATCYPSMMEELVCGEKSRDSVVVDGNIITSRGMGTCIDFGLKMIEVLISKQLADDIGEKIVYQQ